MELRPIGYMLLKIHRGSERPIPAWTLGSTSAFMVATDADSVADIAAQLNGTSDSGQYRETVAAYRATHQPGDRYIVGAVIPWR